ncbi:MAG TPA: molybdate ABC transporter permease subunit [Planctomycetota bacterium]|nr:molybdate ABC transporter permease subunit [Planctomycetota bacterium]
MTSSVLLSLWVGALATLLALPFAVLFGLVLARSRAPWATALQALVWLPLVLPPAVTGYLLLGLLGPRRPLGSLLARVGVPVAFDRLGAIVAAAVVGFPLLVMFLVLALRAVDPRLAVVSRSCGRGPVATFVRVTLPLAWPGILAGAVLAFARALGEFGATIVLAGNIPGRTDTISLRIYDLYTQVGREGEIAGLVAASIAIAVACVVLAQALDRRHRRRLEVEP